MRNAVPPSLHPPRLKEESLLRDLLVRIGHLTVKVRRIKDLDGAWGLFQYHPDKPSELHLDESLTGPELARILLHELMHAAYEVYVPTDDRASGKHEERFVDATSRGLAQVLKDHPEDIMRLLVETLYGGDYVLSRKRIGDQTT